MRASNRVIVLVTPYLADANNGNWRTASRWARLAAPDYRVIVQAASDPVVPDAAALIALHARRSHDAAARWRAKHRERPLLVVLTGTDLYKDVPAGEANALSSIALADRLIVLQEDAPSHLPEDDRPKVRVVFQSARELVPWPRKRADRLRCVLVAHMREEKDPATAFAAWRRLPPESPITLTIVGAALDPALGRAARDLCAADPRVQWLGPREHAWTRQAIKRAHVLLVPSRMEGGANVVVEAVTSATAVVASRMSGNVGMLGRDYGGYFPVGDADALAALLTSIHTDRSRLSRLEAQGRARSPLFSPQNEARTLKRTIREALASTRMPA
jgi:putative glycosyltransferase (TIGR04348 family)